jgi:hypothetical protein
MISLLIPTRKRFHFIKKSLSSVVRQADDINQYEVLFAIDDDDLETRDLIEQYCIGLKINYKIIIFKRLYYKNFHIYVYELFQHASGQLLWAAYPDDMEILTPHWDTILNQKYIDKLYLKTRFKCNEYKNNYACEFDSWKYSVAPILNRRWLDATKRIGCNSQTDVWLGTIASELDIVTIVDEITCDIFNHADGSQHNTRDIELPDIKKEWLLDKTNIQELLNKDLR